MDLTISIKRDITPLELFAGIAGRMSYGNPRDLSKEDLLDYLGTIKEGKYITKFIANMARWHRHVNKINEENGSSYNFNKIVYDTLTFAQSWGEENFPEVFSDSAESSYMFSKLWQAYDDWGLESGWVTDEKSC